jgi:glucose/arabinose dehydrogenase
MRLLWSVVALLLVAVVDLRGATLPGFRTDALANVPGFISSVVTDSLGTVYCTTTDGWIHRVDGDAAVPVAALPTKSGGNGGLLGMALLDDATAVVHYTTWSGDKVLDDVIATVDLATGALQVLKEFAGDVEFRERGVSDEHHGGNLTVAPDGSIYVGIGEYGTFAIAQNPKWNGGKIWRLDREGNATQFARGLRNPYDLAWDPELNRLVVADNGPQAGDEINIIAAGDNCGWPQTYGNHAPMTGAVAPAYVFPSTVAPTGLLRMSGANHAVRSGYLAAAFVTKALYYFPDLASRPVAHPIPLLDDFEAFVIDVTESPQGAIYFATASFATGASTIHRLQVPNRGDCNGDGLTDVRDIVPTIREIADGETHPAITAQDGDYSASWGCDANADSLIDDSDLDALMRLVTARRRAVRR